MLNTVSIPAFQGAGDNTNSESEKSGNPALASKLQPQHAMLCFVKYLETKIQPHQLNRNNFMFKDLFQLKPFFYSFAL